MKNYIGLNIKYLCETNFLSQDELGARFGLKKSVVGTYVRGLSHPKVEVMQKICSEFNLTLDELVNQDLYLRNKGYVVPADLPKAAEPQTVYNSEKQALLDTIQAQKETIAALKETIAALKRK